MSVECMLCAEEAEFIGVGECNHEPICYRCIYKMRMLSKNNQCPVCKTVLKNIIIMEQFQPYQSAQQILISDKNFADIYYSSEKGRTAFQKLNQFKCFIKIEGKPCKVDKKFASVAFLKKHLKEDHNRYICEICVQKKTCVLEQQKLYTYKTLNKHLQKGDIDEFGNVTFMHPFCKFCSKHFFDEDQFRRHINIEHMICNVCSKQYRYRYYKNYDSLEIHYKMSHYICSDELCLAKKFIAFKNADELRVHKIQYHQKNSNKKIDIKDLCGFQYEGHNPDDQIIVLKDNEGVEMEDQFLNLKKCKNKLLGEADQQTDRLIDLRVFYDSMIEQDQFWENAFVLKHNIKKKQSQQERPSTQQNKKKKYIQKTQLEKEKPQIAKQNEYFTLQDLILVPSFYLSKISYQEFENKAKSILSSEQLNSFNVSRNKLNRKQIKPLEFFQEFLKIMKNVSLRSAYLIFPHYLRTLQNQDLREDLDQIFLAALKKIPLKHETILSKSQNYSDIFRILLKEIEQNLESRITSKNLSIKKPIKREKQRLFQIMGVVRRLKIQQMSRFKYATNFGIQKDTVTFIVSKIFKKKIQEVQKNLDKIQNDELLDLYTFVKFCFSAIKHSKNMQVEKNKIHENILEDFLFERPYLEKEYGLKKEELTNLDDQIEYEQLEEEKKAKRALKEIAKKNEKKGFQIKTDFNLVDKGDFPDLIAEKKQEIKKEHNFKEVIQQVKEKPATYQKKINEMFPTLGSQLQKSPTKQQQKKQSLVKPPQEKAWWQKINETKKPDFEQEQEERVRVRKGKKKQKWVSVKGLFN